MGILLSRFRKKHSTKELLEQIEQELDEIDDFRFSTQQHQRRWVGRLIIFSVITYLVFALLFFVYFFPSEISKQILYSLPLFIFPLIVLALKWMLHWYYAYRLSQNADQMVLLQRRKKKILKEVMATETYVVAKEILEKYDPDRIRERAGIMPSVPSHVPEVAKRIPDTELRRRSASARVLPMQPIRPQAHGPPRSMTPPLPQQPPVRPGYNAPPGAQVLPSFPRHGAVRPTGVPLPCPILPRQRGTIDRLVEFVVGDGPNNRYALICRQCQSHNGMALREEFEFIGFRCCYCFYLNPARKQRPLPPRLPSATNLVPSKQAAAADRISGKESGTEGPVESLEEGTLSEKPGVEVDKETVIAAADVFVAENEELIKGEEGVIQEDVTPSQEPVVEVPAEDKLEPKSSGEGSAVTDEVAAVLSSVDAAELVDGLVSGDVEHKTDE